MTNLVGRKPSLARGYWPWCAKVIECTLGSTSQPQNDLTLNFVSTRCVRNVSRGGRRVIVEGIRCLAKPLAKRTHRLFALPPGVSGRRQLGRSICPWYPP